MMKHLKAIYFKYAETLPSVDGHISRNSVYLKVASPLRPDNLLYDHTSPHSAITFKPPFNHIYLSAVRQGTALSVMENIRAGLQLAYRIWELQNRLKPPFL